MTTRNSDRLHVVFAIRGIGTDADGKSFEASGRTVAISRNGAAIVLNHHLTEGQEIIVRRLDRGRETMVRVLKPTIGESREIVYGVVFVNPAVNLWDVEFPQLSRLEEPLARVLLRCDLCGRLEVVHLDEVDMEVLEQNQQIGRFCKLCSALTSWRQRSDKTKKQQVLMPETRATEERFRPASSTEKRRHSRVRTTVMACIRQLGRPDDVVTSEDLSRGGLRFRSRSRYPEGAEIEVAIPYTVGSGNIFVPARIVFVKEIKGGFTCGAAYISAEQKRRGYDGSPCEITNDPSKV